MGAHAGQFAAGSGETGFWFRPSTRSMTTVRKRCPGSPRAQSRMARLASAAAITGASTLNAAKVPSPQVARSEEHTSELQSLMRNSYAVFCLKKKKKKYHT